MQTTNNIPGLTVISAVLGEHEALINVDLHQSTSFFFRSDCCGERNGNRTVTQGQITMPVARAKALVMWFA